MRIHPVPFLSALLLTSTLASAASRWVQSGESPQDPARDYWQKVARVLNERHTVRSVYPPDPAEEELRVALATAVLPQLIVEDEEHLAPVLDIVRALTGLPIVLDSDAQAFVFDEGVLFGFNLTHPLALDYVLDLIADAAGDEVAWTIADGTVLFTTREKAREERVIFLHPIADLLPTFYEEDLATLVMENVRPGSWEEDGVAIEPHGTFLVITHAVDAQVECESFLADLRRFHEGMASGVKMLETEPVEAVDPGVLERLETVRVAARFGADGEGVHLVKISAFLQQLTEINFRVESDVLDEFDQEELMFVLELPERSVREVLDLLVRVQSSLAWRVQNGVVQFVHRDQVSGGQTLALHDIRELIFPSDDAVLLWEEDEPRPQVLEGDLLEDLIRNNIAVESWDWDPANSLRISESGVMLINQRPEVQAQIRSLLDGLRAIARVMRETQAGRESDR